MKPRPRATGQCGAEGEALSPQMCCVVNLYGIPFLVSWYGFAVGTTSGRARWAPACSQCFAFLLLSPCGETAALYGWSEDGRNMVNALMLGYIWGHKLGSWDHFSMANQVQRH